MTRLFCFCILTIVAVPGICSAQQDPIRLLEGAWAQEGFACDATFEKSGGSYRHLQRGASSDTGLIIHGRTLETPDANCTIRRVAHQGDIVTVNLSCATQIMATGISTSFRIIDQNRFEHFENAFPEISFTYNRCQ